MTQKKRKISKKELQQNIAQFSNRTAPRKTFTVIDNGQKSVRAEALPRVSPPTPSVNPHAQPIGPALQEDQPKIEDDVKEADADFIEETRTQRAKLLAEYAEMFKPAAQLLMSQEADSRIGTRLLPCVVPAGSMLISTSRFIGLMSGILNMDLSAIPLGHDGNICPQASKPSLMTLVDHDTGVHATKVTFCGCRDSNKWQQLMDANLFPATVAEPQTAFSFRTLRHWQLITLQSKITAYDYVRALRRQTDNVFTGNVPDVYKQFQFVSRIWPLLEAEKRFGGVYGNHMNKLYPCRPQDNVMVYCPACPKAGINMEPNWDKTPPELRHLNMIFNTIDGNFKTGNYAKNNDPNNVSLFAGRAYMPNQKHHQHYLEAVPQIQKEKATCSHLKVENGANRAKFKNMSVTGNVNVQCSHMFVCSSVDMKGGENHATVDLAIKLRVESCRFDKDKQPHQVFSYDNMYSLAMNIVQRWLKFHKDDADVVQKASWTIPACHVNNHHEGCDYLYCYVYKMCMGHFHGKTAEYAWAIFNAIGPSVLQMSIGHCIDTLIIHYGDWNWRKVVGSSRQLEKDLNDCFKTVPVRFRRVLGEEVE
ncbi:hypothetical protein GGU11DRAFT_862061 [Lentinula aff. detonsa]|nr:hypothetical protein GGU11DRAFT_862061 [Lentinula aff. detonsa]